jgi:hypothetical protein
MRKIFPALLMGISALFFVASLVALGLLWFYKGPLTAQAQTQLSGIETDLQQALVALQNAKTELERTLRLVNAAEESLLALKQQLGDAKSLVGGLEETLDSQIIPSLKISRGQVEQAKVALNDARSAISQLNEIPFVQLNLPGDALLANLISLADSADRQIASMETLAEQASVFAKDLSYLMGGDLAETRQNLQNFLRLLTDYEAKLNAWLQQVQSIQAALPGWANLAAALLSLNFIWLALSQVSVFVQGRALWRGQNGL